MDYADEVGTVVVEIKPEEPLPDVAFENNELRSSTYHDSYNTVQRDIVELLSRQINEHRSVVRIIISSCV